MEEDIAKRAFDTARSLSKNPPPLPARRRKRSGLHRAVEDVTPAPQTESLDDVSAVEARRRAAKKVQILRLRAAGVRSRTAIPSGPDGRAPRRSYKIPSIGQAVGRAVKERGWQEDLAHGWIMGHWNALVGERIAAHCQPTRISDQVVHVACDNSNWATQLRLMQRQILQRIAEKVGPDVIVELKIHGPKQRRNFEGRQYIKPHGSQDTYG